MVGSIMMVKGASLMQVLIRPYSGPVDSILEMVFLVFRSENDSQ